MKNYIFIILLFAGLSGFSGDAEWKLYTFNKASFKMQFPKRPQVTTKNDVLIAKASLDGVGYSVSVILNKEFDLSNAQALLDQSVKGFIDKKTDKVVDEEYMKIAGYSAKEVRIKTSQGIRMIFRIVLTKNKLYQFVLASPDFFVNNSISKKFLNSFQLIKE